MEDLAQQLGALYEDPSKLEAIRDPRLRLRAAAFINQVRPYGVRGTAKSGAVLNVWFSLV